ncbi:MAG: OmpA family protein [Nitrospirota bacterium]
MQKPTPSQVASGGIAPAIVGPSKDMKDIYIVAGVVLILAVIIGVFWVYSPPGEPITTPGASDKLETAQVSSALWTPATSLPEPAMPDPAVSAEPDVLHADVYFEVGRKGLTDEGKALLQHQAEFLKSHPDYGVLVQGSTDQQGSASYNKTLGLKRAESVKQFLVGVGVPDTTIKIVSLGEEGALCADISDICRKINRRVHLELRRIGKEHLILTSPTVTEAIQEPTSIPSEAQANSESDLGTDGLRNEGEAVSKTESVQEPVLSH